MRQSGETHLQRIRNRILGNDLWMTLAALAAAVLMIVAATEARL